MPAIVPIKGLEPLQPNDSQPSPPTSVVGRIRERWKEWRRLGAPDLIVNWVQHGFDLRFEHPHRVAATAPANRIPLEDKGKVEWTDKEIQRLLEVGALRREKKENILEFSPLQLEPKKGPKKFRLVVDMRRLNTFLVRKRFKYEGLRTILRLVGKGFWMWSLDLAQGYHHLSMRVDAQKYLGIQWKGVTYVYTVLPFGLATSPWAFTKLIKVPVTFFRRNGVRMSAYLDDLFFTAPTRELALEQREFVLCTMRKLGLVIEESKSKLEPAQRLEVLGMIVETLANVTVKATPRAVQKIRSMAERMLAVALQDAWLTPRRLYKLAGKMQAVSMAVAPCKLITKEMYRVAEEARVRGGWDCQVTVTDRLRKDLRWLKENLSQWNGRGLLPHGSVSCLFTDASPTGFGARLAGCGIPCSGSWNQLENSYHINVLEVLAVKKALITFQDYLIGKRIQLHIDSRVAMGIIWRLRSVNPIAEKIAEEIWEWTIENRVVLLKPEWIASEENIADEASRICDLTDWRVAQGTFLRLNALWGPHDVDRFADHENAKTPSFNSRYHCPGSAGVNAFAQDWRGKNNWVVPPFGLLGWVIRLMREQQAEGTVIVPNWGAPWWPELMEIRKKDTPMIPLARRDFTPGPSGHVEPWKNERWSFLAVRVGPQK